jgi:serine/threonine protein kinase
LPKTETQGLPDCYNFNLLLAPLYDPFNLLTFDFMSQNNSTYVESHILKRFTILKKVGSGAYGHVWKVEEKSTKRIFALKKIFDAFQHATDAQRTFREI